MHYPQLLWLILKITIYSCGAYILTLMIKDTLPMKTSKILFTLLSALSTSAVFAQDAGVSDTGIRYNQVGLGYTYASSTDNSSLTGYALDGRALVNKDIYVSANYTAVSKTDADISRYGVYAGYRLGIASNVDFFAEAGVVSVSYKGTSETTSSTGYDIAAGVNAALTPDLQGSLKISYPQYGSNFSDLNKITFGGSLTYYVTKEIGASAIVSSNSTGTAYGAGMLYAF